MIGGVYLLRVSPYRVPAAFRGRPEVVHGYSAIEPGAIVMLQQGGGVFQRRTAIRAAMRVGEVATVDQRGSRCLTLTAASVWKLRRRFTIQEALGPRVSYDRDCPIVRLSAEHAHAIRADGWLGAEVGPFDEPEIDEPVRRLFLTLWDKAGTKEYDKREWNELRDLLHERGIVI